MLANCIASAKTIQRTSPAARYSFGLTCVTRGRVSPSSTLKRLHEQANGSSRAVIRTFSPLPNFRFCSDSARAIEPKPKFSLLQWRRETIARLKEKKAQVLVEYGSTFIFLHEMLGITSYAICFTVASLGLITIDDIINFIGVVPDNIAEMIANKRGTLATNALTALVLLKCLDWLGLVPLRWFLSITLTPRVAWWVGPKVDAVVAAVKSKLPKRASTSTSPSPSIDSSIKTHPTNSSDRTEPL